MNTGVIKTPTFLSPKVIAIFNFLGFFLVVKGNYVMKAF